MDRLCALWEYDCFDKDRSFFIAIDDNQFDRARQIGREAEQFDFEYVS